MDVKELFKGIAVVIDDEIESESASINKIVSQLKTESIPLVKMDYLPSHDMISNLHDVSFVLLDWQLFDIGNDISRKGMSELQENNDKQILEFVEELLKVCFCPIFIFTTLSESDIIEKLKSKNLYTTSKMNMFFIKQKDSIMGSGKLFEELSTWVASNSVIYLLKQWDAAYQYAKENLFIDLQNGSSNWVGVLYNSLKQDGDSDADIAIDLFDTVQKNITNRILVPQLDSSILASQAELKKEEIIRIIEQTKFVCKDKLNSNQANTGDLFFDSEKNTYYINIRPQCDLLRCKNPELYCLKGKELKLKHEHNNCYINEYDSQEPKKEYFFSAGEFIEQKNNCIISYINNGKIIEFKFKSLIILKWNDVKSKRVGKLLSPFVINIRQKYATYIEREGLPRLPNGILDEELEKNDDE